MTKIMNRETSKTEQPCTFDSVSGSITIHKRTRLTQRAITSKSKWFDGAEYFTIINDGECLIIRKHYLEVPKNAHIYTKLGLTVEMDLPIGNFDFDEDESTEDELVIYYD